jgi:predicted NAD/FAD-binding protein
MRIAIVGGGISGLFAARILSRRHDVTVFESAGYAGGHTNTVDVAMDGERHAIDTGFIVFNHKTYPGFTRLLEELRVPTCETTMSFSVRSDATGLEYNGTSLNSLFAQRRNVLSPAFHRMVRDMLRFNRRGAEQAARAGDGTVQQFLEGHDYGPRFRDHYLVPMGASIWSCPPRTFLDFPMRFVMDFFSHHGMLQVQGRPTWRVVRGGSARYVDALAASFAHRIRLQSPVHAVRRTANAVAVRTQGRVELFDEVVIAVHSDQALSMLEDASHVERSLLGSFPYQTNTAVLHTDTSLLPRRRLAWAAWNYRIPAADATDVMVTYNMNILQRLESRHVFCLSLNQTDSIRSSSVLGRFTYHHPVYTTARDQAQRDHSSVIRQNRTSFCGAYWGYGFHEDGLNSARAVCRAFGEDW